MAFISDAALFLVLSTTVMATSLGASMVVPLLPIYAQGLGATGFEVGLIFSGFAMARTLTLPMIGSASDLWGRRRLLLIGLALYTAVAFAFTQAGSIWQLVVCRFVLGAGAAMVLPVARAYVGDMAKPGREGLIMGRFNMAFFGGLALGPWIGGFIKDVLSLNAAFEAMAILSGMGLMLSLIMVPTVEGETRGDPNPTPLIQLLKHRSLATMFLFRFGSVAGMGILWTFMPLYCHEKLHLSSSRIGVLVSLTVIMTTLLQPTFGRLADRFNKMRLTVLGGVLTSVALLFVPAAGSFGQLFVVNVLMGVAMGAYMPPLMAMAVEEGRALGVMNRVMSLLELAFSIGMVAGPLLAGFIKERFGVSVSFYIGGTVGIFFSLLFLVIYRPRVMSPATPGASRTRQTIRP